MLDAFTEVLVKRASDKKIEDDLTEQMLRMPMKDIRKVASGMSVKKACVGKDTNGNVWLRKYEGTPLYDKAIALEESLLAVEAERISKRLNNPPQDDLYAKEDMIRLKKRQLDLELSKDYDSLDADDSDIDGADEDVVDAVASEKDAQASFVRKLAATEGHRVVGIPRDIYRKDLEDLISLNVDSMSKNSSVKEAARRMVKTALSMQPIRQLGKKVEGATYGAMRSGAFGGATGAAGGAAGGALFGGVGAAPGAAIGGAGGAISGGISGAIDGWKNAKV